MAKFMHSMSRLFLLLILIFVVAGVQPVLPVYAQATTPVQINGIFNPDTIYPSQTSRLTVNVFNPNVDLLTTVNWRDNLPDDLIVVDPPNPMVTGCGGSYILTATPGANFVRLTGATTDGTTDPVNPGVCSVTVSVTSFSVGNHTNVIHKADGSVDLNGVVKNYEYDANITLLVLPMTEPEITKSFSPNNIDEGDISRLTINIANKDANVALTQVNLTDTLPTNMTVNTPPNESHSGCGSGTVGAVAGANSVTLTNGTIAVSSTCTISFDVAVTGTGTFTNTIHPADLTTYQKVTIPGNATANLVVKNIVIEKSYSPTNFQVGGTSTLSIRLSNPGTADLTDVDFTDTMDDTDVTVVSGSGGITPGCAGTVDTSNPLRVSLIDGVIPAGGSCTITATVRSNAVGTHDNTLSCSDITFGVGVPGCASTTARLTVYAAGFGLTVEKSFSDRDIEPGTSTRMTITIRAPGDVDLTNFHLNDTLPTGVTVYSLPNAYKDNCGATSVFTPSSGDTALSLTNATIPRGTTCTLSVDVTSSVYGMHTNVIHAIGPGYPTGDIGNDQNRNIADDVSDHFTVRDISVTKSFASSLVGRNGLTTLTITLTNNFNKVISNVAFTDSLPGTPSDGVVIADPNNLYNSCNGMVTANPGTQPITLSGGIISANQSCTIRLDVRGTSSSAPLPGTRYTNSIAIGQVTGMVEGITPTRNWHATSADITVGSPDFRINKKFDPILVTGDTASTMTITLVNTESSAVHGITFTDTLPTHMLLADPPSPSVGTCGGTITPAADRKSFQYSGGSLAGNSQCKLTIQAMMEVTGNLINTIGVRAVTTVEGATNLQSTSATLTNLSSVGITKKFDPNPVSPGGTSNIILTIKKIGIGIGLTGLGLTDNLLYGLTVADPPNITNTCSGSVTAAVGSTSIKLTGGLMPIGTDTCTISVSVLVPSTGLRTGGYENCIPIGTVVTDQGYTNVLKACDTLGNLYDPPTGYKTFDASGFPLLEWRMVWINDHDSANIHAEIYDNIPTGTTFVTGSLSCVEQGISRTDICEYLLGTDQIHWVGSIGQDRGATGEADANNEVIITFRVTVPDGLNLVSNQGVSTTDRNGDGSFADETTTASISNSNLATWYRFAQRSGSDDDDIDARQLPASGFTPDTITILPEMPVGIYQSIPMLQLEIPTLGVKSDILGLYMKNREWDVTWLGDNLGYLEETAFPTWNGNSVITGHVYKSDGKPGPFQHLNTLRYGDTVIIHEAGARYIFEVRDLLIVQPDDFKAALKHEEQPWLTLMTCQNYDAENNQYLSRVLVRAVLMRVEH